MNAIAPASLLRVAEDASSPAAHVAVLGRDIRTSSERIAEYCVTAHEPVYEDLATLVESIAFWDRRIVRKRSAGWMRQLPVQVPVYEHRQFQRTAAVEALTDAVWFLTGDRWSFEFVARKRAPPAPQGKLPLLKAPVRHVVPFSDGLDSFAQARLSEHEHGRHSVMLVRSGLGRDRIFPHLQSLRVPRKFGGGRMREVSYRTRPLVFYTFAGIAAATTDADAVVLGENGQGSFGPACLPFADEWWFRSAHPAFIERWAHFLSLSLEKPLRFEQPQLWKTKAEVLTLLREQGLTEGWEQTRSCATRPQERYGHHGCGICGGCVLRTIAAYIAGLAVPPGNNAFDLFSSVDIIRRRNGVERQMTTSERAVAVRAISSMAEFARLADSSNREPVIDFEARLLDPTRPSTVQAKLLRLLRRHRDEWGSFLSSLPRRSWVREIVGQL